MRDKRCGTDETTPQVSDRRVWELFRLSRISCRRHDIDPQLYLTQLLFNLPTTQTDQLSTWLPDKWKLN